MIKNTVSHAIMFTSLTFLLDVVLPFANLSLPTFPTQKSVFCAK